MNEERYKEILNTLPEKERTELADALQELTIRAMHAEMVLDQCRIQLYKFFMWHESKKSRESAMCDDAHVEAQKAALQIGAYLEEYGVKGKNPQVDEKAPVIQQVRGAIPKELLKGN